MTKNVLDEKTPPKIEELNISQENTTDQAILDETSPTINSDNI